MRYIAHLPDVTRKAVRQIHSLSQTVGYQISTHHIPDVWLETEGEDITIAVLDTGCQADHEDLQGSVPSGINFTTNDKKDFSDRDGHGTHCSGIISANNNTIGIVGVAPKAKIMAMKVLGDDGSGTYEWIISGIMRAVSKKVDIISMSLGGSDYYDRLHDAVRHAYKKGIPIICAAGNSGNIHQLDYPGRYPETISIGALNKDNIRAEFSQTGEKLDFMAPGVDILSTVPVNQYQSMSGTSMATPWAAGIVALIISKHRKSGGGTPINGVEDIKEHLRKTAIDMGDLGKDEFTGFGLIDVDKMLSSMQSDNAGNLEIPDHIPDSPKSVEERLEELEARLVALEMKG